MRVHLLNNTINFGVWLQTLVNDSFLRIKVLKPSHLCDSLGFSKVSSFANKVWEAERAAFLFVYGPLMQSQTSPIFLYTTDKSWKKFSSHQYFVGGQFQRWEKYILPQKGQSCFHSCQFFVIVIITDSYLRIYRET